MITLTKVVNNLLEFIDKMIALSIALGRASSILQRLIIQKCLVRMIAVNAMEIVKNVVGAKKKS